MTTSTIGILAPWVMAFLGAYTVFAYAMSERYRMLKDRTPYHLWLTLMVIAAVLFLAVDVAACTLTTYGGAK